MIFQNSQQLINNGRTPDLQQKRKDILTILENALNAVNPYQAVKQVFDHQQIVISNTEIDFSIFSRIFVVGFGKASVGMTRAVLDSVPIQQGIIITNQKNAIIDHENIQVIQGGHPLPNQGSMDGTHRIINLLKTTQADDIIVFCISGGGSALFCCPRISLNHLQTTTELLLESGADINEINTIRKHLSYVKGGQLLRHTQATVLSLIISDIIDDPLEFIASGPTSPDSTTFSDAKKVLEKYHLWHRIPDEAQIIITKGIKGTITETPKENDPLFDHVFNHIIANNTIACQKAVKTAQQLGYKPTLLTTSLAGEAREIGKYLVNKFKENKTSERQALISGGETTVTLQGKGRGGRNQELVLGCIEELKDTEILLGSFATDGIDGKSDAAGSLADGYSAKRAGQLKLDYKKYLSTNNSYEFFLQLHDLLVTGPSGTNVMDIQVIL